MGAALAVRVRRVEPRAPLRADAHRVAAVRVGSALHHHRQLRRARARAALAGWRQDAARRGARAPLTLLDSLRSSQYSERA